MKLTHISIVELSRLFWHCIDCNCINFVSKERKKTHKKQSKKAGLSAIKHNKMPTKKKCLGKLKDSQEMSFGAETL